MTYGVLLDSTSSYLTDSPVRQAREAAWHRTATFVSQPQRQTSQKHVSNNSTSRFLSNITHYNFVRSDTQARVIHGPNSGHG